jgi:biopolymer transport protein ExbB
MGFLALSTWVTPALAQQTEPSAISGITKLIHVVRQCGILVVPLALGSFLLVLFVFERLISLRRARVIPRPFVRRFVQQLRDSELDQHEALQLCRENNSPIAQVFASAIMKWDRSSVEVEQAMIDAGERISFGLKKYLRLFNGIATISPLLGLLGTVMGMIRAFNTIASADAMGRPDLLASGISQALLTTAAGLTVAIPAYVAHVYFSARVDKLVTEIDRHSQDVVNAVAIDGWKEKVKRRRKAA